MGLTPDEHATALVVLRTLRWVAGRTRFYDAEDWTQLLADLEHAIDAEDGLRWSCPVCEELTCDNGCPLQPLRS